MRGGARKGKDKGMPYNEQLPILKEPRKDGGYGVIRNEDIMSIEDSEPHGVVVRSLRFGRSHGGFFRYPGVAKCWIEWWGA